jgi:hypothetical protein
VLGLGDRWSFNEDLFTDKGLGAEAGGSFTLRTPLDLTDTSRQTAASPEDFRFGTGAAGFDSSSANIASIRDTEGTAASWSNGGTGTAIADNADVFYIGTGSVRFTYPTTGPLIKNKALIVVGGIAANASGLFSCYIKQKHDETTTIGVIVSTAFSLTAVNVANDGRGQWRRVEIRIPSNASSQTVVVEVREETERSGAKVFIDAIQLETYDGASVNHPYAWSSFMLTSRASPDFAKYPLSVLNGAVGGMTINFWCRREQTYGGNRYAFWIGDTSDATQQGLEFHHISSDPGARLTVRGIESGMADVVVTNDDMFTEDDPLQNNWFMVTCILEFLSAADGEARLYRNGVLGAGVLGTEALGRSEMPDLQALADNATIIIGNHQTENDLNSWAGIIDQFVVLPYVATQEMITAWYADGDAVVHMPDKGIEMGVMPQAKASGDFAVSGVRPESSLSGNNTGLSIPVEGEIGSMNHVQYSPKSEDETVSDTWYNNAAILQFRLDEV